MDIAQLATMIVGYTEIFKNIFRTDKQFLKFLISLVVGAAVIAVYCLWGDNQKLMTGLTAFAAATLCYDTIVKRLKDGRSIVNPITHSSNSDSDIDRYAEEFADPESSDQ